MMKDYQGDYESGYFNQMTQRALAIVRSTALFCLTLLLIGGAFLYFVFYNERFSIVGYEEGVYVFDRSNLNLSHCSNTGKCFTMAMKKGEDETPEPAAAAPAPTPAAAPASTMVCVPQMIPTPQGMVANPPLQTSALNLTAPATQNAVLGNGVVPSSVQQQMNIAQQQVPPANATPTNTTAAGNSLFQPTPQPQWAPLSSPTTTPIPATPAAPIVAQPVTFPSVTAAPPMAPAILPSTPIQAVGSPIAAQAPALQAPPSSPTASIASPDNASVTPPPGASIVSAIAPGTGILGTGDNAVATPAVDDNTTPAIDDTGAGSPTPGGIEGVTSPA